MRVNVYSQELTKQVTLVKAVSDNGKTHYGVRFWMQSPPCLHHTPEYDDRSAVTFWLPDCDSFTPGDLADVFAAAHNLCCEVDAARATAVRWTLTEESLSALTHKRS